MPNIAVQKKEIVLKKKIKPFPVTEKSFYKKNESKVKKQPEKDNKSPLFCVECDKELNIFWLSDMATDKKAVKTNFENCKKTGKFNGRFCSKMFISGVYTEKDLKKKK